MTVRYTCALVAVWAAVCILPAGAGAATVSLTTGELKVTAASGEANHVSVSGGGSLTDTFTVDDSGATLVPQAPECVAVDANTVRCTGFMSRVTASLGDGADTLGVSGILRNVNVAGGPGADTLSTGVGMDVLDGGEGPDELDGGAGVDTVTYADRTAPLNLSLDGAANDGVAGEGDNIGGDVENLIGGTANDVMTGNGLNNSFAAKGGNDTLNGGSGDDTLSGEAGNDTLNGNDGDDTFKQGADFDFDGSDVMNGGAGFDAAAYNLRGRAVRVDIDGVADDGDPLKFEKDNVQLDVEEIRGGPRDDTLVGDGDANTLIGNGGVDQLVGAGGSDFIRSRDAPAVADNVQCGAGEDVVTADETDTLAADCEIADLPTSPGGGTGGGGDPGSGTGGGGGTTTPGTTSPGTSTPGSTGSTDREAPAIAIQVRRRKLRAALRRGLPIRAGCFETCGLSIKLRVTRRTARRLNLRRTVGGCKRGLDDAGMSSLTGRFMKRAKRKLRRQRSVRLTVVVTAMDPAGNIGSSKRTVRLRR